MAAGSVTPVFAAMGVTNGTMKIGGSAASISTIDMSGNRTFEIMVANQTLDTHQSSKGMVSFTNQNDGEVVAAVNGGFFSLSDWSVCNTMIQDGRLIAGAGWSNAVGITYDGQVLIDTVKLFGKATITKQGKDPYTINSWIINRSDDANGAWIAFLNEYCRKDVVVPTGGVAFFVENGRVAETLYSGVIDPMVYQDVILYNSVAVSQAEQYGALPAIGDAVSFGVSAEPKKSNTKELWENTKTVMGGAVMLVSNGQNVAYTNDYSAADQQPNSMRQRVFVAKMSSGQLIMGTVYSSYVKIAEALIAAGAIDAMAMDGGSSSMLYSNGEYLRSAGRELTMGLAVVDEAAVSRIPNVTRTDVSAVMEPIESTEEPPTVNFGSDGDVSDMDTFFAMVNKAFDQEGTSDINSSFVSTSPEMIPNTSIAFASGESQSTSDGSSSLAIIPPTSMTESTTTKSESVVETQSSVQSNQNSYLTQREFGNLLVDIMEEKHEGVLMNSITANGLIASNKEEALSKLDIFTAHDPAAPITRAQAAVAIMRAHRLLSNKNSSAFYSFTDCSGLEDEVLFAINYVVGNGLMGASGSLFNPNVAFTVAHGEKVRSNF